MTPKQEVANGNGYSTAAELPRFKRHIHPETGEGLHKSWSDCALTDCTWAGSTEAFRAAAPAPVAVKPKPKERRNETTHPDGQAAVDNYGCPTCKARKAAKCIRHDGERTNHVHSARLAKWDESQVQS